MKYLRFYIMMIICLFFLTTPLYAAQATPQRIAILPVQFMVRSDASADIAKIVNDPIAKKFRHALNSFTKKYEYLSLNDIERELPALDSYPHLSDAELIDLANRLDADILLAPIVARATEQQISSFTDELIQETYVEIHLIGYERSQDHIIRLSDHEYYSGTYGTPFSLEPLTREVMLNLTEALEDNVPAPLINK